MARETFVDTSGFYALLAARDDQHKAARELLRKAETARKTFVTTDYVLDETATLLMARGHRRLADQLFRSTLSSAACRIEWMDPDRFERTASFFRKHHDHDWSFTDCMSFVVMRELGLREALSKDVNFEEAGFVPLLSS